MTDYLKSTYGKDFMVGKPKYYGSGLFPWSPVNDYIADSYPHDEPDLKFAIIVLNWDKAKTREFKDNYLGTKWSKQGAVEMEKKLREVYGEDFWLKEYWMSYNDKRVKDWNYPEIIKKYADKMRVDIGYFVFIDNKMDKKHEAEREMMF